MKIIVLILASLLLLGCSSLNDTPLIGGLFEQDRQGAAKAESSESAPDITVTVLGSGTPRPSRTQAGPAILVEAGGDYFMFDCGRGCTTRLAQLDPKLIDKVDHLFITHLHSDHIVGIPDLWLNGWAQNRQAPLKTWGPEGTIAMMEGFRAAFSRDIAYRTADGVPAPSAGLDSAFTDLPLDGGVIYDDNGVKVTAFRVDHSTVSPAYGYKIEYRDRLVVISGDTTATKSLYTFGRGADVLMLEVFSPTLVDFIKGKYQPKQVEKLISYHLTVEQAADILAKSDPGLGVYYHTGNQGVARQSVTDMTKPIYAGPLVVSHDLMQIRVGDSITVHDMTPE